jgi:hypothetical protein
MLVACMSGERSKMVIQAQWVEGGVLTHLFHDVK